MKKQIFNNDKYLNIQTLISNKLIFDKNSDRKKRRIEQIQKRKKYLNETDSLKAEKSTFNSTQTPTKLEDFNFTFQSFIKKNYEQDTNNSNHISDANNIIEVNQFSINTLLENNENEYVNLMNEDKEINISDIDCNINELNNDDNNNKIIIDTSSKEYAKNFCSSNLKSFIQLNNNLIAHNKNKKNTPSYLLALCPDSLKNNKKSSSNYMVNETIKEENEIEVLTKENNNNEKKCIKVKKNKDLLIETRNIHKKISHKKSKSGNCIKDLLINYPNKINQFIFNIHKNKNKNLLTHVLNNYKTISPCSKTVYNSPLKKSNQTSRGTSFSNNSKNKKKLNYNLNRNSVNNINSNKIKEINNYNNNYDFHQSKRVTLSGKNQKSKLKIFTSNNYSSSTSNSISQHIKNKTLLVSPSFKNDNKSIKNSYYMNDSLYKRNHNKFINKNNFRLFDLKKALKSKLNNQYNRKVNVNNLFFAISPLYSEHKKTNLTQSSFSNCNISNRSKISSVIKKFNFSPLKKKGF